MDKVITISAMGDNFIYLYVYGDDKAAVIDPGSEEEVLKVIKDKNLNLTHILVTHHHYDHTGGVKKLVKVSGSEVIDYKSKPKFNIGDREISIISTPGHTSDSVCYYFRPRENHSGMVFTGDSLFIGGCGRPMECGAEVLWESLEKIAVLDDDTLVYSGHDYTEENYEFALTIDSTNELVRKNLDQVKKGEKPAGISTVGNEKKTNIFLQCNDEKIKRLLGMAEASDREVFAELRRRKNIFG